MSRPLLLSILLSVSTAAFAGESDFSQQLEMQGSFSNHKTPFWLNSNKYGLSSLSSSNGYLRYQAEYKKTWNDFELFSIADIVAPVGYRYQGYQDHYTSHLILQQLNIEARYKQLVFSIGSRQRPMELRNNQLSSGAQTLGINARPVPQVYLGLQDFWSIPGLRDWVAIKGHCSFGVMTDGEWESAFTNGTSYKYNQMTRFHEKAGYMRIGKEDAFPLTATLGLEMAGQFGGKLYNLTVGHDIVPETELNSNLESYVNILFCKTSADLNETVIKNNEGNILGSWVARLDWKDTQWAAGIYFDHFFEDHSGLFFLDYDGYGSGEEWHTKKENRFFTYDLADFQIGADLELYDFPWLNHITVEYLNTTYQSGPIYHDHNQTWSDHICGRDDYYNNRTLPGWQHWGQVIGNPLYLSPQYNKDGYIQIEGNRFRAFHVGLSGDPLPGVTYRCLMTYQKNWGSYYIPSVYPRENFSYMFEVTSPIFRQHLQDNLRLSVAWGQDFGKLLDNNTGVQLTLKYSIR